MSFRSADSSRHSEGVSNSANSVLGSDAQIYQYALRVAYLSYLLTAKPANDGPPTPTQASTSASQGHGRTLSRGDAWTTALNSLGDVFGPSRSKEGVRFPKEFIKALGTKIQAIATGNDRDHRDELFRATVGAFYGSYNNPMVQKNLKENRKVEELIITFVSSAQVVLKRRFPDSEAWKDLLMQHVGQFVAVIRDTLKGKDVSQRHVSKELMDRLNSYLERLSSSSPSQSAVPASSTNADGFVAIESPSLSNPSSGWSGPSLSDMDMVKQVGLIFRKPDAQLMKDLVTVKRICDEKIALRDLKTCISLVNQGARFPGRREDFDSDEAYTDWRKMELDALQQQILNLATVNRDALRSEQRIAPNTPGAGRPTSLSLSTSTSTGFPGFSPAPTTPHGRTPSLTARNSTFDYFSSALNNSPKISTVNTPASNDSGFNSEEILANPAQATAETPAAGQDFTFIPPAPRSYYSRLLDVCLEYDLDILRNLEPHEEVSLRILSKQNTSLLSECAKRWRVQPTTCSIMFLSEIAQKYQTDDVPLVQCVIEAMQDVNRSAESWDFDNWIVIDRTQLQDILSSLFDTLVRRMYDAVQNLDTASAEEVQLLQQTVEQVHSNPLFQEGPARDLPQRFKELQEAIEMVAAYHYDQRRQSSLYTEAANGDPSSYIMELLRLLDWFRSAVQMVDRMFRAPVLGEVDFPAIYVSTCAPMFAEDLQQASQVITLLLSDQHGPKSEEQTAKSEKDVRELYESVRELLRMHQAFCPEQELFVDLAPFEPYVFKWLEATHSKTLEWVQRAVGADQFEAEGSDHHSSSIVDLIESCKSAVAFVQNLEWPDPVANAQFLTRLSHTIAKAIEEYCQKIEGLFMSEMFPARPEEADNVDEQRSAWLVKAKGLYQADKKAEPFALDPASLVKLNNIQAARNLLDKMYTALDADRVAEVAAEQAPPVPEKAASQARNLFSVKIVLAETLASPNGTTTKPNPFLTLSNPKGERLAKTRTLYDTSDPRWSETFDISVHGALWLAATAYSRNLVEDHKFLGRALIHLDPRKYDDYLPHELWLDLNTNGRLLVRISMEGEKDDIQFYFGRAFRSLKRTEADMVRIIVDKMSPMIRQFLSRQVIKSLVKKGGFNFDLNLKDLRINEKLKDIKLDKIRSMFASQSNDLPEIPPFEGEIPSKRASKGLNESTNREPGLTDVEIEEAIGPLFEYFEVNFVVVKGTLNDTAFAIVMGKIWKEILSVIEGLLVPPLSEMPADMRPLSDKEVYIVIRWLKGLSNFFYAEGEGVPIEDLHNARFRQILALPLFYEMNTDSLMMECNRALNQMLTSSNSVRRGMTRSKSVYQQRNLGTIRQRKSDKRQEKDVGSAEMMMRILRMRPNTQEFLSQQITTLDKISQEAAKPVLARKGGSNISRMRGANRQSANNRFAIPPIPEARQ